MFPADLSRRATRPFHLFLTEICKLFIRMPFGLIFNNSEQICQIDGLRELLWEPV